MTNTKVLIILDIKQATPRWTNYISELIITVKLIYSFITLANIS